MRRLAILLCFLLFAGSAHAQSGLRVLALTDIHFDPTASGITPALAAAPVEEWAALLQSAKPGASGYPRYGRDTPWSLLHSALDAVQTAAPSPAFVIVTGDLLAHGFRWHFQRATGDADHAHYTAFVLKTTTFVLQRISAGFPGRPLFLALGNDDSDCGDYRLAPSGVFLHGTLPLVQSLAGAAGDPAFAPAWLSGEGYDLPLPGIAGHRVIFLNSVYFSRNYEDVCGTGAVRDPGAAALDWLEARLAAADAAGEHAWLLMHVPPGGDVYEDRMAGHCPNQLPPMWKPAFTRQFLDIMARHPGTIRAIFAGHTHMDEFRLVGRGGRNLGFVVTVPAISPIYGQNPGFGLYEVAADGALLDRQTWIADNLPRAASGEPVAWRQEYGFDALWGAPQLDLPAIERLSAKIREDALVRNEWLSVFRAGNLAAWNLKGGIDTLPAARLRAHECAIRFVDPDEYARCYCETPAP